MSSCLFMYHLLQGMEFQLITGFGVSSRTFRNDEDPSQIGQGMLQGSSSAAPIYNISMDVSLSTYQRIAHGATFKHPITGQSICDHATQYVDDKTEMLNANGTPMPLDNPIKISPEERAYLFQIANLNTDKWTRILWISGGNLNLNKCFYYYLQPSYNHGSQKVTYANSRKAPGNIVVTNPATNTAITIQRVEPREAKRTLGVMMAPDGNAMTQYRTSKEKATTYLNRIKHSKLPNHAKWKAITTVLEPAVLYPLMANCNTRNEMMKIEKILSKAKCHALGLNEHFPRAVLHGPTNLGGIGIPKAVSKTTTSRINYFFFHTRMETKVGEKINASLAYLQIESGLLQPFLTSSYATYGHYITKTLMKRLWEETEPNGLILSPADGEMWIPQPQGHQDIPIMELVARYYSKKETNMLNRYRLYLQVISIYDLITYKGDAIHPAYTKGNRPLSRISTIYWVDFPKPPKKYRILWQNFLSTHIEPLIKQIQIQWNTSAKPNYNTSYYYSATMETIYVQTQTGYQTFIKTTPKRMTHTMRFRQGTTIADIPNSIQNSLHGVDVERHSSNLTLIGLNAINTHGMEQPQQPIDELTRHYNNLPEALQRLCGKVSLPPDGGKKLLEYLRETNTPLHGASDTSLKEDQCAHAWILTTGEQDHIEDPLMSISGMGPVDGYTSDLSSYRGELQGQTALVIMSNVLQKTQPTNPYTVKLIGDNKGVQQKTAIVRLNKIGHHREANSDLYMEYMNASKPIKKKVEWVKSHQDKDTPWSTIQELKDLKLSTAATLNVWCDKQANVARSQYQSYPDAEVYPNE
jgi:hypothetical protein